jgi:hypothetical protein
MSERLPPPKYIKKTSSLSNETPSPPEYEEFEPPEYELSEYKKEIIQEDLKGNNNLIYDKLFSQEDKELYNKYYIDLTKEDTYHLLRVKRNAGLTIIHPNKEDLNNSFIISIASQAKTGVLVDQKNIKLLEDTKTYLINDYYEFSSLKALLNDIMVSSDNEENGLSSYKQFYLNKGNDQEYIQNELNKPDGIVFQNDDYYDDDNDVYRGGRNIYSVFLYVILIVIIVCVIFKMINRPNRIQYYKQPMYRR